MRRFVFRHRLSLWPKDLQKRSPPLGLIHHSGLGTIWGRGNGFHLLLRLFRIPIPCHSSLIQRALRQILRCPKTVHGPGITPATTTPIQTIQTIQHFNILDSRSPAKNELAIQHCQVSQILSRASRCYRRFPPPTHLNITPQPIHRRTFLKVADESV